MLMRRRTLVWRDPQADSSQPTGSRAACQGDRHARLKHLAEGVWREHGRPGIIAGMRKELAMR